MTQERKIIEDTVSFDEAPPYSIDKFQKQLSEALKQIPRESYSTVVIDCQGSYTWGYDFFVSYKRPETDAEFRRRLWWKEKKRVETENSERKRLAELKAKYEGNDDQQ